MKTFRIILTGLVIIPAVFCLISVVIGLLNVMGGSQVYGAQRAVASLILLAVFIVTGFLLWPGNSRCSNSLRDRFKALPDKQSRVDFVVSTAISKLGLSNDEFDSLLTTDLNYPPNEVMSLWDELSDVFGIELSADDYPDVNSIEGLRRRCSNALIS